MVDYYEAALREVFTKDEQRLWLEEVVNRLSGRPVWKCHEIEYWNHPELPKHLRVQGYYGCFQSADRSGYPLFLMISRSHTSSLLTLDQIVDDLGSPKVILPFARFGEYYAQRRRRGLGTHATIKFGERWYMISMCGRLRPYYRLTEQTKSPVAVKVNPPDAVKVLTLNELRKLQFASRSGNDPQSTP